jgi:prepilin-type N-terminal cleavage/methylation domain-containing protein
MNNKKAFTLVELCVVIAIFGILALIAAPNLATGLPKYRIKRAARDITSKIRAARSEAIKTSSNVTIVFDLENHRYSIDGTWYPDGDSDSSNVLSAHYGSGVSFGVGDTCDSDGGPCSFTDNEVIFNSRGINTKDVGEIYLTNTQNAAYRIRINTAGNIQLQHCSGSWQ